jgi:hypothetical protein
VHVRRILMAARRLEVAVGRVLHAREFPTSGTRKPTTFGRPSKASGPRVTRLQRSPPLTQLSPRGP